jgi:hypothetical protein
MSSRLIHERIITVLFRACASIAFTLIAALLAETVQGHHSLALFERSTPIVISGVVKNFQWTSPHVWIYLAGTNVGQPDLDWAIEAPAPAILFRQGWRRSTLATGDKVSLTIYRRKDGTPNGALADQPNVVINGVRALLVVPGHPGPANGGGTPAGSVR